MREAKLQYDTLVSNLAQDLIEAHEAGDRALLSLANGSGAINRLWARVDSLAVASRRLVQAIRHHDSFSEL